MLIILDIKNGEIAVVIIPNSTYSKEILSVTGQLANENSSVCYVSLNKPYQSLIKGFDENKIDKDKFLFIDAITKPSASVEGLKNCIAISSISALTELSIVIMKSLEKGKFEGFIFDSLSTMLIYHDTGTVTKFVYNLITKLRELNCTVVFTCLEGDSQSALIKDLGMFIDKEIKLK